MNLRAAQSAVRDALAAHQFDVARVAKAAREYRAAAEAAARSEVALEEAQQAETEARKVEAS